MKQAFQTFSQLGIPGSKHEEWKYTRIAGLFNKEYQGPADPFTGSVGAEDLKGLRLPGHEQANELVFVNGFYSFSLSRIRSANLRVLALEEASSGDFHEVVSKSVARVQQPLSERWPQCTEYGICARCNFHPCR